MKKVILFSLCVASFLVSCDQLGQKKSALQVQNDSLMLELSNRDAELDEIMGSFNEIQEGFREINEAENRVDLQGNAVESKSSVDKIREDIRFISEKLQSNREQIAKLEQQLKNSKMQSEQLKKAIDMGAKYGIKVTIPNSFNLELEDEKQCAEELEKIHSIPFFKSEEEVVEISHYAESVVGEEYRIVEDLADCYWEKNLFNCDGICEWCIEKPYIDLKGDVFVCCINASYRVGNIFEYDSFMDLWNNDIYKKIRSLFYKGQLPGFCDNCQFILNGSLRKLQVSSLNKRFYQRRHISKFYHDYCEVKDNE